MDWIRDLEPGEYLHGKRIREVYPSDFPDGLCGFVYEDESRDAARGDLPIPPTDVALFHRSVLHADMQRRSR